MTGTIKFGMALVLVCTVVSTVNCGSLYSPTVDQLSTGETDSQRIRRDFRARPGATVDINVSTSLVTSRPGTCPPKLLCRQVLTEENSFISCDNEKVYEVKWNRTDDNKIEIWFYQAITHDLIVDGTDPSDQRC